MLTAIPGDTPYHLYTARTVPTPDTHPGSFTKQKGDQGYINNKTGEIYKKSHTSHGNAGNKGKQWKVYPKGTKNFGKGTGQRTTVDGQGNIIGD